MNTMIDFFLNHGSLVETPKRQKKKSTKTRHATLGWKQNFHRSLCYAHEKRTAIPKNYVK